MIIYLYIKKEFNALISSKKEYRKENISEDDKRP